MPPQGRRPGAIERGETPGTGAPCGGPSLVGTFQALLERSEGTGPGGAESSGVVGGGQPRQMNLD